MIKIDDLVNNYRSNSLKLHNTFNFSDKKKYIAQRATEGGLDKSIICLNALEEKSLYSFL